jgi:hypothetical protein
VEDVEVSSANSGRRRSSHDSDVSGAGGIWPGCTSPLTRLPASASADRSKPLLVNPIPRFELVAGKWLAAVTSSMAG